MLRQYLAKHESTKMNLFTQMLHYYFAIVQPVAAWCRQHYWLATDICAASWLPKRLWAVGGHSPQLRRKEVGSWTVLRAQCAGVLSCWKTKFPSATSLMAANICWDIPVILSIDFHFRLNEEQLLYLTQRLTPRQTWKMSSMWVTDDSMQCSLPQSYLMYTIDYFANEGCCGCDHLNVLYLLAKQHKALKWIA